MRRNAMRLAFVIAISSIFLTPLFLTPVAAGTSDRGEGARAGEGRSGLFVKRKAPQHRQAQRNGKAALKEEPFCVRPFEYPRQAD